MAKRRKTGKDKTVRLGVVGVGGMGTAHARMVAAGDIAGAELVAVSDVDPSRLTPFEGREKFADSRKLIVGFFYREPWQPHRHGHRRSSTWAACAR